mmetsp:Transcript_78045/g.181000  ORF Transcript_78045/g.181000 Transcript_78045/m.181000 type:complete len:254 (+) Transcript_78045:633-1394(+)
MGHECAELCRRKVPLHQHLVDVLHVGRPRQQFHEPVHLLPFHIVHMLSLGTVPDVVVQQGQEGHVKLVEIGGVDFGEQWLARVIGNDSAARAASSSSSLDVHVNVRAGLHPEVLLKLPQPVHNPNQGLSLIPRLRARNGRRRSQSVTVRVAGRVSAMALEDLGHSIHSCGKLPQTSRRVCCSAVKATCRGESVFDLASDFARGTSRKAPHRIDNACYNLPCLRFLQWLTRFFDPTDLVLDVRDVCEQLLLALP